MRGSEQCLAEYRLLEKSAPKLLQIIRLLLSLG